MKTEFVKLGVMDNCMDTVEVNFNNYPISKNMILRWSATRETILDLPRDVALKLKREIENAEATIWKDE